MYKRTGDNWVNFCRLVSIIQNTDFLELYQSFLLAPKRYSYETESTHSPFVYCKLTHIYPKMIRQSIAKAFDPLYESPLRNASTVRYANILNLPSPTNEDVFTGTIENFPSANHSIDQVKHFIEDIITEAIDKIFPDEDYNQANIIDITDLSNNYGNDLLLEIEGGVLCKDTSFSSDFIGKTGERDVILLEDTFDLDAEVGKVTDSMLALQLEGDIDEKCQMLHNLSSENSHKTEIAIKDVINISSDSITLDMQDNHIKLDQTKEMEISERICNLTQEILDFSNVNVAQELHEDNDEEYKIVQELNSTKDDNKVQSQAIDRGDSPCKHEKEYLDKMNHINQLNELIVSKNEHLDQITEKLLQKEKDYNMLMDDYNQRGKEITDMRLKFGEYEEMKFDYVRKKAEVEALRIKCEDYDILKKNYELKQEELIQLTKKYEDALRLPTPIAKNTEDVDVYKNQIAAKEKEFQEIMNNYTQLFEVQLEKYTALNEECSTAKKHLANLEVAFTDVHQKYERSKAIIEGYKANEEKLNSALLMFETTLRKYKEQFKVAQEKGQQENESLRKNLVTERDEYVSKLNNYTRKIKHLEIKTTSLTSALEQKTKECQDLTKLCEEVIDIKSDGTSEDRLQPEIFSPEMD
ncbi:hypothetical protein Trydic_g131 [Trypoxylus dichotomus]